MKKLLIVFQLLVCVHTTALSAISYEWSNPTDAEALETSLLESPIISVKGLRDHFLEHKKARQADWSTNVIKIVTLEGGLLAVFKKGEYAFAEVAAYRASKLLGLGLVPPTVFRTVGNHHGSLQLFVPSVGTLDQYKKKLSKKELSDMAVFYFICGQWDLHQGNQLIYTKDGKYRLALIDNASMLHRQQIKYGEHAFVEKGHIVKKETHVISPSDPQKFPFSTAKKIDFSHYKAFRDFMRRYIKDDQIKILWRKKNRVPYVIWHNSLWMQIYHHSSTKPAAPRVFYASTLDALKRLSYETLLPIWKEGHEMHPAYFDDLTNLILERRDRLMEIASASSAIREDRKR